MKVWFVKNSLGHQIENFKQKQMFHCCFTAACCLWKDNQFVLSLINVKCFQLFCSTFFAINCMLLMSAKQHIYTIDLLFGCQLRFLIFLNITKVERVVTTRHQFWRSPADFGYLLVIVELYPLVNILAMYQKHLKALIKIEYLFSWTASDVHLV